MPEPLKNKKQEKMTAPLEIEFVREHVQKKIAELEAIKNQYIGAIEAYKEVLNTIVDREQSREENKVTKIKEHL